MSTHSKVIAQTDRQRERERERERENISFAVPQLQIMHSYC